MSDPLLLGLRCLDSRNIQSVLVPASLEHGVREGIQRFLLAIKLSEREPEPDTALNNTSYISQCHR